MIYDYTKIFSKFDALVGYILTRSTCLIIYCKYRYFLTHPVSQQNPFNIFPGIWYRSPLHKESGSIVLVCSNISCYTNRNCKTKTINDYRFVLLFFLLFFLALCRNAYFFRIITLMTFYHVYVYFLLCDPYITWLDQLTIFSRHNGNHGWLWAVSHTIPGLNLHIILTVEILWSHRVHVTISISSQIGGLLWGVLSITTWWKWEINILKWLFELRVISKWVKIL